MKARAKADERSLHATIVLALKHHVSNMDLVERFRDDYVDESLKRDEPQAFKCPVHRCPYRALSAAARCNDHGRQVIPA